MDLDVLKLVTATTALHAITYLALVPVLQDI